MNLHKKLSVAVCMTVLLTTNNTLAAPPGTLDPNFSGDGVALADFNPLDASALAVLQQTDGKVVSAGYSAPVGSPDSTLVLARYNTNGALDTSFSGDGVMQVNMADGILAAAVNQLSNGKLVTVGWVREVGSSDAMAIVRTNSNGTLDTSFSNDGVAVITAGNASVRGYAMTARADGSVLAAGCTDLGGATSDDFLLANVNSVGVLDLNFGDGGSTITDIGGGTDCAYGTIKQKDGRIVLLGEADILRNGIASRDFGVVRYQSNGALDKSFSGDAKASTEFRTNDDAVARAGMQQKDGRLVVVGSSAPSTGGGNRDFAVARFLANGSLDNSFGGDGRVLTDIDGGVDVATGVIQQWDGKLLVAGTSNGDGVLVRYNTNGALDTSFGVGGILITSLSGGLVVNGMALQGDGQVVVAGHSFSAGREIMATLRYLFDDDDNDTILDVSDNCQFVANADQENHDTDEFGDACDDDDDNDGVLDVNDAFPFDPNESVDTDGDGIGNNADDDDDNDGVLDVDDPFPLDPFLLEHVIGTKNDRAGYSVAMVGDVNGDGFADILVGAPKTDVVLPPQTKKSSDVGIATLVYGNKYPQEKYIFSGAAKGDEFGTAVTALGDVNGDTVPDFAIGAPKTDEVDSLTGKIVKKDRGSVTIYSGADFSEIFPPLHGEAAGDNFGAVIAAAGDVVGGDGRADFIVGAPKADGVDSVTLKPIKDAGAAYLYSGANGVQQHKFMDVVTTVKSNYVGSSLAVGADLNHDGVADIAIGAYRHDPLDSITNKPKKDAGSVFVYSSAAPYTLIKQLDGEKAGDQFGYALAVVNEGQDAFRDLLVGSPRADITVSGKKLKDAGRVQLFASDDGTALYSAQAAVPQSGALFGAAVAAAGDVNASGNESFVVGAPKTDTIANGKKLKDAGQVLVRRAAAGGNTVFIVDGKIAGAQAGFSVASSEDFNNDANDDVLIGSPYALFNKLAKAGIAEVISGKEASAAALP